ncbi:hypothetical protein A0H76_1821 [Hepatospora eriocheir]|nr:hypothetical protein A0H76_1821 [Hepatospora eriocheir]
MIFRLRDNLLNGDNMYKKILLEKREFYKNKIDVPENEIEKMIISLSLGGYVIRIPKLAETVFKMYSHDKASKVKIWVKEIMKSVSDLESITKTKNLLEQKEILKEYLMDFITNNSKISENLLKVKSEITSEIAKNYEDLIKENIEQVNEIRKLIKLIDHISKGHINIKYSTTLTDKYIKFLLSESDKDKRELLKEFK